jgi:hypothetical protein
MQRLSFPRPGGLPSRGPVKTPSSVERCTTIVHFEQQWDIFETQLPRLEHSERPHRFIHSLERHDNLQFCGVWRSVQYRCSAAYRGPAPRPVELDVANSPFATGGCRTKSPSFLLANVRILYLRISLTPRKVLCRVFVHNIKLHGGHPMSDLLYANDQIAHLSDDGEPTVGANSSTYCPPCKFLG